jgi:hypothetical protein
MPQLTKLSPTKQGRMALFFDEEFAFSVDLETLAQFGLQKGMEFTKEEYEFWLDVRNTHAIINGKTAKQYTKEQMLSWYNKLHTDGAEYKMWGNGIALPNALYVMQGIADVLERER